MLHLVDNHDVTILVITHIRRNTKVPKTGTSLASSTLRPRVTLRTRRTYLTRRTNRPRHTSRTRITLGTLRPRRTGNRRTSTTARITLGTLRPLRTRRAHGTILAILTSKRIQHRDPLTTSTDLERIGTNLNRIVRMTIEILQT